jgi:hypothetical protein
MLVNPDQQDKSSSRQNVEKRKGVRRQLVIKVKLLRLPKITKQAKVKALSLAVGARKKQKTSANDWQASTNRDQRSASSMQDVVNTGRDECRTLADR